MLSAWTSREKKLAFTICILAVLLISMLISSWGKEDETKHTEFIAQSLNQLEQADVVQSDHDKSPPSELSDLNADAETILVDIKGAVQNPYVYQMQADDRVIDVIDQAGGLLATASTVSINLAQKVFDGMVIYIPTEEELQLSGGGEAINAALAQSSAINQLQGSPSAGKININTASAAELESLPGIGPSRSKAIITYREEKGLFSTPEDLMNVSGIGPKIFANLKDEIEVR